MQIAHIIIIIMIQKLLLLQYNIIMVGTTYYSLSRKYHYKWRDRIVIS